jgi:hypothetical protein
MWKKTDKWRPARYGGSGAIAVEKVGSPSELGLAKLDNAVKEKLASDLAVLAGVRVPKVEADNVEGHDGLFSISHAHGKESLDLSLLRETLPGEFGSAAVQGAIKDASGMVAFHAWTKTVDQKDDHLVLDRAGDGTYAIAGVDFQHSFQWQEGDGGSVDAPGIPPCMANSIDKARIGATVAAIEGITNEQINNAVNALTTSNEEKKRLIDGLIGRREKLRERMKAQGWQD